MVSEAAVGLVTGDRSWGGRHDLLLWARTCHMDQTLRCAHEAVPATPSTGLPLYDAQRKVLATIILDIPIPFLRNSCILHDKKISGNSLPCPSTHGCLPRSVSVFNVSVSRDAGSGVKNTSCVGFAGTNSYGSSCVKDGKSKYTQYKIQTRAWMPRARTGYKLHDDYACRDNTGRP